MNRYVLIALFGCAVFAAHSQQSNGYSTERVKEVTATIEAVNQEDRSLVLRGNDDLRLLLVVGADVRNFEQIRAGDRVSARYREAVAVEVLPRRADAKPPKSATVITRAPEGERPAIGAESLIATTVTIESVDTSFGTVTFKRPDGIVRTVAVENPKSKEFIRSLRRGDEVQVTYSEAVALDLRAAN